MILPIYIEPQPVLHKETKQISEITPEIIQLAESMRGDRRVGSRFLDNARPGYVVSRPCE